MYEMKCSEESFANIRDSSFRFATFRMQTHILISKTQEYGNFNTNLTFSGS